MVAANFSAPIADGIGSKASSVDRTALASIAPWEGGPHGRGGGIVSFFHNGALSSRRSQSHADNLCVSTGTKKWFRLSPQAVRF